MVQSVDNQLNSLQIEILTMHVENPSCNSSNSQRSSEREESRAISLSLDEADWIRLSHSSLVEGKYIPSRNTKQAWTRVIDY